MTENKKATKIDPKIAPILDAFLAKKDYQDTFKDMAFALGYKGDENVKIKEILFTVNEGGDIGFVLKELNDMFLEFQIIHNLSNIEPYKTLLQKTPEKRPDLVAFAKKVFKKEEITNEDLERLFKQ
jgi:hypothetical protein